MLIVDIAPLALNRGIRTGPDGCSEQHEDYYIEFNLEMLDDTFSTYERGNCSVFDNDLGDGKLRVIDIDSTDSYYVT